MHKEERYRTVIIEGHVQVGKSQKERDANRMINFKEMRERLLHNTTHRDSCY